MWKMLLKYLPLDQAASQCQDLEDNGTEHEKHFSLLPLIEALGTYVKKCRSNYYRYNRYHLQELQTHWVQQVGGTQFLLPAHVINEYCHPSRSFYPCPDFSADVTLPRSMEIYGGQWFTAIHHGGTLGVTFGVTPRRDGRAAVVVGKSLQFRSSPSIWSCEGYRRYTFKACTSSKQARHVLQRLLNRRQQQLRHLKNDLASRDGPMIGLGR